MSTNIKTIKQSEGKGKVCITSLQYPDPALRRRTLESIESLHCQVHITQTVLHVFQFVGNISLLS